MCPQSHLRGLRCHRSGHAPPAVSDAAVYFSFFYLSSYISLCFAVVAKTILEVKLQKKVTRKQAGRKARDTIVDVEVFSVYIQFHIGDLLQPGRESQVFHR